MDPETPHPVIDILPEQRTVTEKGGTMRLGAYPALLSKGTVVHSLYGAEKVFERHRHRYEVNPEYHQKLQEKGMVFSGMSPNGKLVEFIELPDLKFFCATQAHPELKSRMESPSPLFFRVCKGLHGLSLHWLGREVISNNASAEPVGPDSQHFSMDTQYGDRDLFSAVGGNHISG